ncbi:MAG TPA: DUF4232 domain-containing protein, partial [Gemmatimonadaceae bacterium]|nr:DUF4232 domain-containing protein [Gemmatimonadaceae bacterium]
MHPVTRRTRPAHRPPRRAALAWLLAALCACGRADEPQHRATDTTRPATAPAGATAAASDGDSTRCGSAALALSRVAADAGAGSRSVTYALTNVGAHACTLAGHPGLVLADAAGRPLPGVRYDAIPAPDGSPGAGEPAPPVTLAPGEQATFTILFTGIAASTCPARTRRRSASPRPVPGPPRRPA